MLIHRFVRSAANHAVEVVLDCLEDVGRHVEAAVGAQTVLQVRVAKPAGDVDRAFASGGP